MDTICHSSKRITEIVIYYQTHLFIKDASQFPTSNSLYKNFTESQCVAIQQKIGNISIIQTKFSPWMTFCLHSINQQTLDWFSIIYMVVYRKPTTSALFTFLLKFQACSNILYAFFFTGYLRHLSLPTHVCQ